MTFAPRCGPHRPPPFTDFGSPGCRRIHRIRDLTHAVPHRHHYAAPCPACEAFALAAVDGGEGITCAVCGHHLSHTDYDQHTADFLRAHQDATPDAA